MKRGVNTEAPVNPHKEHCDHSLSGGHYACNCGVGGPKIFVRDRGLKAYAFLAEYGYYRGAGIAWHLRDLPKIIEEIGPANNVAITVLYSSEDEAYFGAERLTRPTLTTEQARTGLVEELRKALASHAKPDVMYVGPGPSEEMVSNWALWAENPPAEEVEKFRVSNDRAWLTTAELDAMEMELIDSRKILEEELAA